MRALFSTILTATLMIGLPAHATTINCSNVNSFKNEVQQLKNKAIAERNELMRLKKTMKTMPTDESLKAAEDLLIQLRADVAALKSKVSPTPAVDQKTLEKEIKQLDADIAVIDKKVKSLQAKADANKQSKQQKIDNLKTNSTGPQIANITSMMPVAKLSDYDSVALETWIDDTIGRTDDKVTVTRGGAQKEVDFKDLDAREMVQYDLITSPEINTAKAGLNKLFKEMQELQNKEKAGVIKSHEKKRLQAMPGYILNARNKLYQLFEKEFTALLSDLRDLKQDVQRLKTLENDLKAQVQADTDDIGQESNKKTPLVAEKTAKEQALDQLKNNSDASSGASQNADLLKQKQDELNKQEGIVNAMKNKRQKWFDAKQKFIAAKRAYEDKKAEEANFDIRREAQTKKAMRAAHQQAKAAHQQYKQRKARLQNRFKIIKAALEKKKRSLQQQAKQLVKEGKYNTTTRNKIIAEWRAYKRQLMKKAEPQVKNVVRTSRSAAQQIRMAARSLDPYNCPEFPKAQAYRNKLLGFVRNLVKEAKAARYDIMAAKIQLPPLPRRTISGYWNSNFGCTAFSGNGSRFRGTIYYTNGNMGYTDGVLKGDVYKFRWRHRTAQGRGRLTLSGNGKKLTGRYRDTKGSGGNWILSKRAKRCVRVRRRT